MEDMLLDINDIENNIWAVRKIGLDALHKALGEEGTKSFLGLWRYYGTGRDCVKLRHELNKTITNEEILAGVLKIQEENGAENYVVYE